MGGEGFGDGHHGFRILPRRSRRLRGERGGFRVRNRLVVSRPRNESERSGNGFRAASTPAPNGFAKLEMTLAHLRVNSATSAVKKSVYAEPT